MGNNMTHNHDVAQLRNLFPVTNHWTYLYNGSIHPCALPVADAMTAFISDWQNGGEAAVFPALDVFAEAKERFAALINADPKNIVVTESTTAAINLAAQLVRPAEGQNVVVTDLAFMSNTFPWMVSHPSAETRFVKNRNGKIHIDDIAARIDENTAAVHICAVTVGSGFRYDLSAVHALTSAHGVPLIVDGAQALGVLNVNVADPPVDFLATTASKWLMGPAGVGFLYVADRYLDATPPAVGWLSAANTADWDVRTCVLHEDAMRFQGGIPNLVGVVGARAGLDLLHQIGREYIEQRVRELTSYLMDRLGEIGVDLWTPLPWEERAGIVFLRTPGHQELHAKLKEERIYCGCFLGGIRLDPTFYNTTEELDRFLGVVRNHVAESSGG